MISFKWSEFAKLDYWNNIDYLLENWTDKEAANFIEQVDNTLRILSFNPKAFPQTNYKNIHSAVVSSQITLYHRIINQNTIELIRFWNNYQNPEKLIL